jgi:signal transduction histidine kinase
MLVRPLGGLEPLNMNWPVSYLNMGVAGQIVAFVLSLLAVIFSILTNNRIRMLEQPLTFQQPWEEEFTLNVGKHNIDPVFDRLEELFPGSKALCVLESTKRSGGTSIEPLRSQLSSAPGHDAGTIILALDNGFYIDVCSGKRTPIPPSFEKLVRGLKGLGFSDGILQDFQLSHIGVRLFFSTGGRLDEALRKDVALVGNQIESYFDKATKWDLRRQDMIALARDLARRDLHDGILQSLAALKMRLVTIVARPAFVNHPDVESLRKTIDIITLEQSRLRALLHNDEDSDDAINLVEAMEVYLQTLSLQWEISVKLKSFEPALPVDKESAENIEYLIREAVANAIRHAGAKQLTVALALNQGNLLMTLKDDLVGPGRDSSGHEAAQSILRSRSLIQRLALVNGHAYSDGLEDSTLLVISIPMDFTANE